MKNVVIITGAYPPQVCGVGDYTAKLIKILAEDTTVNVEVFYKSEWRIRKIISYFRQLMKTKADFFHMQYPTEGYDYSLLPLLLIFLLRGKNKIVTIHELSSRNFFAYVYTQFLILLSNKVIVSNEEERKHAVRFLINKRKVSIIPIGSNITPSVFFNKSFMERKIDLIYFGHIRPLKGIEDFIEMVSLAKFGDFNVVIIGQVLPKYELFYNQIKEIAVELGIKFLLNKNEQETSHLLADSKVAYLPFPDGVSPRRGSLIACIGNGVNIISKKSNSNEFNALFESSCYLVKDNEEAALVARGILDKQVYLKDIKIISNKFSWEEIKKKHLSLYNNEL